MMEIFLEEANEIRRFLKLIDIDPSCLKTSYLVSQKY